MKIINIEELNEVNGLVVPPLTTILAVAAIALVTISIFKLYTSSKGKIGLAKDFSISWN